MVQHQIRLGLHLLPPTHAQTCSTSTSKREREFRQTKEKEEEEEEEEEKKKKKKKKNLCNSRLQEFSESALSKKGALPPPPCLLVLLPISCS